MSNYSNDEKVTRYKRRKVLRIILILFAFSTVVTSILCLLKIVKLWIPIVLYVFTFITKVLWQKNDFHDEEEGKKENGRKKDKKDK